MQCIDCHTLAAQSTDDKKRKSCILYWAKIISNLLNVICTEFEYDMGKTIQKYIIEHNIKLNIKKIKSYLRGIQRSKVIFKTRVLLQMVKALFKAQFVFR